MSELHEVIRNKLLALQNSLDEDKEDYERPDVKCFGDFLYDEEDGCSVFVGESNVDDISSRSYDVGFNDGELSLLRELSKLLPKE